MLTQLLIALIIVPFIGFIATSLLPKKQERAISYAAISTIFLEFVLFAVLTWQWLSTGAGAVSASLGALYSSAHYTFALSFYFDTLSAVFFGTATIMTGLVFAFSKYYLHREPGFKRFYYTVLLFFIGLSFITLAGNFEVLLVGWELIGISSVLLIAFYRDRFLPTRNALKVFSVYRIADVFLLAAIWYAHHIFETSVDFSDFSAIVAEHGSELTILGALLLVTALIKSAQFPFSYWLPRAMEGPTTSSAIFYGAISVHMGLFLLLRTYPLWESSVGLHVVIGVIGIVTALVASSITRVQSSIKAQIAYSSVTQIGIMFVEVALGLPWLAVIHFVCNASLRTYQLLISPSVVGYLVHDQFFYFVTPPERIKNTWLGKLRATIYVLSIKEWNMNTAANRYLWRPLKRIGRVFAFLDKPASQAAAIVLFVAVAIIAITAVRSSSFVLTTAIISAVIGIVFYLRSFATKNAAKTAWNLVALGHLFGACFLALASHGDWKYLAMYGSAIAIAFVVGHLCLRKLETDGESTALRYYSGSAYVYPMLGHVFFVTCLFFMAFPISPSFLAQDILLSAIPRSNGILIAFFCFSYLLAGVSIMRIYTKTFFGSHKTSHHEVAYTSS